MSGLVLRAVEVGGPTRWRWLLTDADGRPLASHQVDLDATAGEFGGFEDLYRFLRWEADPEDRLRSGAALTARVGGWIGRHALGWPVVEQLLARAPVTVRVQAGLGFVPYRPWEIASSAGGVVLARWQVRFVFDLPGTELPGSELPGGELPGTGPVVRAGAGSGAGSGGGRPVRVLAVFSLPEGGSVLGLRRERHALSGLVRRVAGSRAMQLRVLQYGVTRELLAAAVDDGDGWDVLHVSGHGARGQLLLETADGQPDAIGTDELVELLFPLRGRLRLAVLSACESGAATAAEALRLLDLPGPARALDEQADAEIGLPASGLGAAGAVAAGAPEGDAGRSAGLGVARGLSERLGCAVLAMRYPVTDNFAIDLAGQVYEQVLVNGKPVDEAVRLAVPRAAGAEPSLGAPPVSLGTPVLLGPATGLRLQAPLGGAAVSLGMAGFPDEPGRFVGRTGLLAEARQVLAPAGGQVGVLLHGMAGAGKTTAAVELAYQALNGFDAVAFWSAPPAGQWAGALPAMAQQLETQLNRALNPQHAPDRPCLRLLEHLATEPDLHDYLPVLTELMQQTRCLLVLDNLETLLSDAGGWLDPRLGRVLAALTGHRGMSRVLLTSRVVPVGLDQAAVRVLAVHTLSRDESVLLARELPHLGGLLHQSEPALRDRAGGRVGQDRDLVRRALAVVQGHPKLLELADAAAADPAVLTARLAAAEQAAAERGAPLAAFLDHGSSAVDAEQLLAALGGWTTAACRALPPASLLLLQTLACCEPDDRTSPVLKPNWACLWARLEQPAPAPKLTGTLRPLVDAALVDPQPLAPDSPDGPDGPAVFRLHPGVADTVRTATPPGVSAAVDVELAAFWTAVADHAMKDANQGAGDAGLLVRAALAGAPYLLRQQQWATASITLECALNRDGSPGTVAAILPLLHRLTDATRGTDRELTDQFVLADALRTVDSDQAETRLRALMQQFADRQQHRQAGTAAGSLLNLLRDAGRLVEALTLADRKAEFTRLAGLGPWTQLADTGRRLQILRAMGEVEQVLAEVQRLRQEMPGLPLRPGEHEAVQPFNVRETLLNIGALAAADLDRYELALELNAEACESKRQRGVGDHELARSAFNDHGPLLGLGRVEQADRLLQSCQEVFEQTGDTDLLGRTLSARAEVAGKRGHRQAAVNLEQAALRHKYHRPDPESIATSHHNLANYLRRVSAGPEQWLAHRLTAGLLHALTGASRAFQMGAALLEGRWDGVVPADLAG